MCETLLEFEISRRAPQILPTYTTLVVFNKRALFLRNMETSLSERTSLYVQYMMWQRGVYLEMPKLITIMKKLPPTTATALQSHRGKCFTSSDRVTPRHLQRLLTCNGKQRGKILSVMKNSREGGEKFEPRSI